MTSTRTIAIGLFVTYHDACGGTRAVHRHAVFRSRHRRAVPHRSRRRAVEPVALPQIASEQFGQAGTRIDAVTDLGIERKWHQRTAHRPSPARKHKFRVNYLPMSYSGVSTIHRDFTFNGIRYGLNLPVTSELSWKTWALGYEYDFLYRDRWFVGFVTQSKFTDVEANLQAPIGTDFVHAQAPIPNIGGIARVYVVPNISITGELIGMKIPGRHRAKTTARTTSTSICTARSTSTITSAPSSASAVSTSAISSRRTRATSI